ncbi:MAG: transposase [Gemmatimonadota bacterium]|nr:transposase [Gemmatimonadota bacterium]
MIRRGSLLVKLVKLVDHIPKPPLEKKLSRGRPKFYSDTVFLKAVIIMIVKHLHKVGELLSVLEEPTHEMQTLRKLLTQEGRYPSRRTWERRLKQIPETLPAQIRCLAQHLLSCIKPFDICGRAAAIDSTVLPAKGGVWHKKDRERGLIPHTSIDTDAHWTKSDYHGWVYGFKLHLITTVSWVWIPLAARLTPANCADNVMAPDLIGDLCAEIRYLLGDTHYNAENVRQAFEDETHFLVASKPGPYPHDDDGKDVRRIFHSLRSRSIENFNEQFKGIFDVHTQVPTKGLINTARFALGAVFVYQLILLFRFQEGLDLRQGLKACLKAG